MVISAAARRRHHRHSRQAVLVGWQQAEILGAARRLFARRGYAAANIEEIAEAAGIAKGTIYLYFPSKEAIFAGVLESDLETLTTETIDAMSPAATLEDRLRAFLDVRVRYMQQRQEFLRVYLAEFGGRGSGSPLVARVIEKQFKRGVRHLARCIEDASAAGDIGRLPAEPVALAVFDLARGLVERHLRGWARLPIDEDVALTHALMLNGLRGASARGSRRG
jgi:AcrR family transcriptional regulator